MQLTSRLMSIFASVLATAASSLVSAMAQPITDIVEGPDYRVAHMTKGADGAMWASAEDSRAHGKILRITNEGRVQEFQTPTSNSGPSGITAGPDGALWFIEAAARKIGRIATGGQIREFDLPSSFSELGSIASGPDGALWFTANSKIGRMTTAGVITEFQLRPPLPTHPVSITVGPDGALWFTLPVDSTSSDPGRIGRITVGGEISS